MEILEYKRFLASLSTDDFIDYLYNLDLSTLSDEERLELEFRLSEIRTRKVLVYLGIFGFLLMVAKGTTGRSGAVKELMSALNITRPEIREKGEKPFDLVWVTQPGACDECLMHEGKIYGKTTDDIPKLHKHCMCTFAKVYREETSKMKAMNLKRAPGGAVRAMKGADDQMVLEVLAAPFGGPKRRDRLGQYLSARTDFMIEVGGRRPTLYLHGYSPRRRAMEKPPVLGIAEVVRVDEQGLWMRTELDDSELSRRTWEAAKLNKAGASTGSIAHLTRYNETTGEVTCWPIAELTVFDKGDKRVPVSDDAVVIPLRALFDDLELEYDERFEAGEDTDLRELDESNNINELEVEMDPKELQGIIDKAVAGALKAEREALMDTEKVRADMKKSILDEIKEDPQQYRAIFNVNKIGGDKGLDEAKLETFAYVRALVEDGKRVADGGMPHMRAALEETEAAELGPMVPTDLADQIKTLRGKYSIVRKSGMTIGQTDKLIFSVPAEVTAITEAATIAEEGAYTDLQPVFGAKTATMLKKGGFVAVTEEGLEDQDLFQQYLVKAAGKSLALAENTVLAALLVAVDGVEVAASHTMTDAEFLTGYFALAQEYRDEAVYIMNDLTLAYIRGMVIANPRAYGEVGFQPLKMGELGETLFGKYVFTNANWDPITTAADDVKIIDFVNLDECLTWVERRGLTIFVDPYSLRLSAGTINFLISARFNGVVTNAAALSGIDDHV